MRTDNKTVIETMQSLPQWVVWRMQERNSKTTKVPYQVNGHAASVSEPSTWTTFDEAIKAEGFDGVGFVFTGDCGIIGIDFDHVLNDDGSLKNMQFERILKALVSEDSFIEVSPSGNGLHAYYSGSLDFERNKQKFEDGSMIEVYKTGRYFTVTGAVWEGVV